MNTLKQMDWMELVVYAVIAAFIIYHVAVHNWWHTGFGVVMLVINVLLPWAPKRDGGLTDTSSAG